LLGGFGSLRKMRTLNRGGIKKKMKKPRIRPVGIRRNQSQHRRKRTKHKITPVVRSPPEIESKEKRTLVKKDRGTF